MAVIGCYSVDLYCDYGGDEYGGECLDKKARYIEGVQAQYIGPNERSCLKQAKRDGWKIRANKAICPVCSKVRR